MRNPKLPLVVGVDVGGPKKGFHAVALSGREVLEKTRSNDVAVIVEWCHRHDPLVIAIDAPCRWRAVDKVRAAEREMAAQGIACYYAPTEQKAREHAFYTWMLPGRALFEALKGKFPVYIGGRKRRRLCIETFPHAVACALSGKLVSATQKRTLRRAILEQTGISTEKLITIDDIDAALCALAADRFASNDFKSYGDKDGGFIIVPAHSIPPLAARVASSGEALGKISDLLAELNAEDRAKLAKRLQRTARSSSRSLLSTTSPAHDKQNPART